MFTVPFITTEELMSPSTSSIATYPESIKFESRNILELVEPFSLMIGGVVSTASFFLHE